MRGEDADVRTFSPRSDGSPPHARGRLPKPKAWGRGSGITPACAGKTASPASPRPSRPDHPRMRGEDLENVDGSEVEGGSPPHARGRHPWVLRRARAARITPACAGKTKAFRGKDGSWGDHPRMRGEDCPLCGRRADLVGSPPHARGRLFVNARDPVDKRITPACAGKTSR